MLHKMQGKKQGKLIALIPWASHTPRIEKHLTKTTPQDEASAIACL